MAYELKDILPELDTELEALKGRKSYATAVSRLGESGDAQTVAEEFMTAVNDADPKVQEMLETLKTELGDKQSSLKATSKHNQKALSDAEAAVNKAQDKLKKFLRGEKVKNAAGEEVKCPEKVGESFAKLEDSVTEVRGALDSLFAQFKMNGGWKEIGKTAKDNLNGMQFWEEKIAKNRGGEIAFRYVGAVTSGAAISHALLVSKDSDGEDRSTGVRVAELLAGVGIGGVTLLAGKAH